VEKCLTCHFLDRRHLKGTDGHTVRTGQCRRCAPMLTPNPGKSYHIEGVWPTVRDDDWCGEWKILPRRPSAAVTAAVPMTPAQVMTFAVGSTMASD